MVSGSLSMMAKSPKNFLVQYDKLATITMKDNMDTTIAMAVVEIIILIWTVTSPPVTGVGESTGTNTYPGEAANCENYEVNTASVATFKFPGSNI